MKTLVRTFCLFTATIAAATLATAQTVKLNLKKSDKYEVVSIMKTNSSTEAMGQTMEMTGDAKNTSLLEVKDVRGGEWDIAKTLTKSAVSFSMMGQEMSYDSEKKDNDEKLAEAMGKEIGKPFNMTVGTDGSIIKKDTRPESPEADMMKSMMQAAALTETDDFYTSALLNRTLKAGDQWQDSASTKTEKMSTKLAGVYMVKAIENGRATISFNGMQTTSGTMEQQGMEMTQTGNNKVTTELLVDLATGLTLQRNTTIALNVSIEVMGMTLPSTGTVTTSTTLKPVQ